MDRNTILHYAAEFGSAAVPVLGPIIMALLSVLFYQLVGILPGFVRAYFERACRENEAMMRAAIERPLLNGLNAAVARR